MAVYKRSYRGYSGSHTPQWSRFLILSRQASHGLFRSRIMTGIFVLCLFPFVITALMLYLNHNATLLTMLRAPATGVFTIDAEFFRRFLNVEFGFCFVLAAFIGPGMISPDLTNNALVLYLCRPISRPEYLFGKFVAMARLLSLLTWVPALLLFAIECSLAGWKWTIANLYIAGAILAGSWILIALLSLLAMALSAWVKWKPVAGALVLAVVFLGAGFGAAINGVMRTSVGDMLSIPVQLNAVCASLFRVETSTDLPIAQNWLGLLMISGLCLYLLSRKVKAYEVVS